MVCCLSLTKKNANVNFISGIEDRHLNEHVDLIDHKLPREKYIFNCGKENKQEKVSSQMFMTFYQLIVLCKEKRKSSFEEREDRYSNILLVYHMS